MLPEFNPTQRHHTADHLTGESPLSPDGQINISSFLEKSSIVREGGVSALECLVCDENLLARIDKMPVKYAVYQGIPLLELALESGDHTLFESVLCDTATYNGRQKKSNELEYPKLRKRGFKNAELDLSDRFDIEVPLQYGGQSVLTMQDAPQQIRFLKGFSRKKYHDLGGGSDDRGWSFVERE